MSKLVKLKSAAEEPAELDPSVMDSALVSAERRHEIRSGIGFLGTVVSALLTLVLAAGVVGGGYAAVKSIWKFIHLPANVKLPTLLLPKLPQISMPHVELPNWLSDRLPRGVDAQATPSSSGAPTPAQTPNPSLPPDSSTAQREAAFIASVRSAVQTTFDDSALVDLGRSACTVYGQGGNNQMAATQVGNDASRLAVDLGVGADEAQRAAQAVLANITSSGLCGN